MSAATDADGIPDDVDYQQAGSLFVVAGALVLATTLVTAVALRFLDPRTLVGGSLWYLPWLLGGLASIGLAFGIVTISREFESYLAGYTNTIAWSSLAVGVMTLAVGTVPTQFERRIRVRIGTALIKNESTLGVAYDAIGVSWPVAQLGFTGVAVALLAALLLRHDLVDRRFGLLGAGVGGVTAYAALVVGLLGAYFPAVYLSGLAVYAWAILAGRRLLRAHADGELSLRAALMPE